jgi:uncharacterized protein with PQ loop repeat
MQVSVETQQLSLIAGMISTVMFASSNVPMLVKAFRTKDLRSYSPTYIVMCNIGNAFHWIYIVGLPFGPIWFLHGFYTIASVILLVWYLRYERWQDNTI